jgi:integrase
MLFRQSYSYYVLGGKRVPAGTPGAKRVVAQSKTYYADVPDGQGGRRRVALGTDRRAALRKLTAILDQGQLPTHERHAQDKTEDAIAAFVAHLASGAGGKRGRAPGARYLRQVSQILRGTLVEALNMLHLGGIRAEPVRQHLASLATPAEWPPPLPTLTRGEMGYRTSEIAKWLGIQLQSVIVLAKRVGVAGTGYNRTRRYSPEDALRLARSSGKHRPRRLASESRWHYARVLRAFSAWLHGTGRIESDVLGDLPLPPRDQVERHARRALSLEEIGRLLGTTRTGPARWRMPGPDRAMLYLLALSTGFRAEELLSLTPAHFRFDVATPHILLPGAADKRGETARQPIPDSIVPTLREWLADRQPGRLFPVSLTSDRTAKLLRLDLAAAGIPYVTESPEGLLYLDFHALRHTYIAQLDRAGLTLKQAMQLARHSTPALTARVYGRASLAELGASVNRVRIPNPESNAGQGG